MNQPEEYNRNETKSKPAEIDRLVRSAVILAIIGMLLVLLFLSVGFQAWSVGLGVFLGMPVMLAGVGLYVIAVIRDLRYRKVLDEDASDV